MSRTTNGLHNMAGWQRITCLTRELIARNCDDLHVGSTLTDPEGHYGSPVVFTEWWWTNRAGISYPVLRDYRHDYHAETGCRHYVATGSDAWLEDPDDA